MNNTELIVIKHGSSVVENANGIGLDQSKIDFHVQQHVRLREEGLHTIEVASGAVVEGREYAQEMGQDPHEGFTDNGLAMHGTARQVRHWEDAARPHRLLVAQLLLTHVEINDNIDDYSPGALIVRGLLHESRRGSLVVANENDAAAFEEMVEYVESEAAGRTGQNNPETDNDWMAAHLAIATSARSLLLLTNKEGFMVDDQVVRELAVEDIANMLQHCDEASSSGSGGMESKLLAAQRAAEAGVEVTIGGAFTDIRRLLAGDAGTRVTG